MRRWIGGSFVLFGLLAHKWAVEVVLSPDGYIESTGFAFAILVAQLACVAIGAAVLVGRLGWLARGRTGVACAVVLAGLGATAFYGNLRVLGVLDTDPRLSAAVRRFVASENRLLANTRGLRKLRDSVLNLRAPDLSSRDLFAERVRVRDLEASFGAARKVANLPVREWDWPVGSPREVARGELELLRPLLAEVDHFRHAKFSIVEGRFVDPQWTEWRGKVTFHALAWTRSGRFWQLDAGNTVTWRQETRGDRWRIVEWEQGPVRVRESERLLFEEVLDRVLEDPEALRRARTSIHQRYVLASYLDPAFDPPHPWFWRAAYDRHPGVSVVDVDGDGYEDIYLMARWGPNQLLRNRGDGTFEEAAARFGLDVEAHCSSAVFADFDNDGDPDLILGRTLARSAYLRNERGRFVDRSSSLVDGVLPYLVSSVSAIDYDGDGLLDVYLATYAHNMLNMEWDGRSVFSPRELLGNFLDSEDAARLYELRGAPWANEYRDCPGPPNVLLHNVGGGRFEVVRDTPLRLFRNTYQAAWADYDGDGDFDVYCANDFAPNNLFRNEGGGRFVDVTAETRSEDIGFGMGVSWADYDGDGDLDLYVTNMFSKAGRRVTSRLPGLDPRFSLMARGNSLLRNEGGRFRRVSGVTPPSMLVEKAGWSWGGQFFDFDNDGYLDVYALSGYETAPPQVEGPVDR